MANHSSILAWRIPRIGSLVCYSPWGYKQLDMIKQLTLGFPGGSDGRESAWNVGGLGLNPRLGRSPGKGTATEVGQGRGLRNQSRDHRMEGVDPLTWRVFVSEAISCTSIWQKG